MPYQTDYSETNDKYYAGMQINPHTADVDTFIAEGEIGFGISTIRGAGTNDKGVVLGAVVAGAAVTEFYGITILDPTRDPERGLDVYKSGDNVSVLWRGDIVVKVSTAVTAGSVPTITAATGVFRQGGASGTTIGTLAGARYLTDADADGLAIVRLYGSEQSLAPA